MDDLGWKSAKSTDEFVNLGVEGMSLKGLAWAIAYGFRPKAIHIHLTNWLRQEAALTSMPRAMDTLLPIVMDILMHQPAQGFLASFDCDVSDLGLLDHWAWKQTFGDEDMERLPPEWSWAPPIGGVCSQCLRSAAVRSRLNLFSSWPVSRLPYPCPHGALREAGPAPLPRIAPPGQDPTSSRPAAPHSPAPPGPARLAAPAPARPSRRLPLL